LTVRGFEKALESRRLRVERVLVASDTKQQVTALVADESQRPYVAKWRASERSDQNGGSLQRELSVYRDNPNARYLPRAHVLDHDLLIVEYVPSCTLRQFLLARVVSAPSEVGPVLARFFGFFQEAWGFERFYFSSATHAALFPFMKKLCLSGPRNTPRHRHRLANAALVSAPLTWLRATARTLQFEPAEPQRIHGDLHLDNVLVTDASHELKVIDWENSRSESPLLDFLYSTAMVHCLLGPHPALLRDFAAAMNDAFVRMPPRTAEAARYFHGLFSLLIATNNRFGGAASHADWLLAWARVPAQMRRLRL
jgi:hypothetical protein